METHRPLPAVLVELEWEPSGGQAVADQGWHILGVEQDHTRQWKEDKQRPAHQATDMMQRAQHLRRHASGRFWSGLTDRVAPVPDHQPCRGKKQHHQAKAVIHHPPVLGAQQLAIVQQQRYSTPV